jgi:hypothetical protein
MTQFNDNLEIGGDLQDEYKAIQEAELLAEAPEPEPMTPADEEGFYAEWCYDNGVTPEEMALAQEMIEFEER